MALMDITREAVFAAIAEHDRIGRAAFLAKYGFKPAKRYRLVVRDREYDSKAIVGAAHGYLPRADPLRSEAFEGGKATVQRLLVRLDFEVRVFSRQGSQSEFPVASEADIEGTMTEARCFKRKRSRRLRDAAFEQARGVCCVCERDFSGLLDGRGVRALQVHHREQLSSRDVPAVTTIDGLAVVCANCHMLLHLDPQEAMKVETLRQFLHPMAATVEQGRREFAEGRCRPATAAELIREAIS